MNELAPILDGKVKCLVLLSIIFIASCTATPPPSTAIEVPSIAPSKTIIPSSTSTITVTPSPLPTATITHTPTAIPIKFAPEHFSFPVAFEGHYALGHKLGYSPCYHWDPEDYDPDIITESNWYNYFHAGDMYILNLATVPQRIVVLSPVSGTIIDSYGIGIDEISVIIQTDYWIEGKRVYVGVHHITSFFPGNELHPAVGNGTYVTQGQPIGIQEKVAEYRPEQPLDIEITMGRSSTNHPMYSGWDPDIFIDPYPYLEDDIEKFSEHIFFDYYRDHCIKGGHFP